MGGVVALALLASWVRVPTMPVSGSALQGQPGLMITRADRLPVMGGVREQIWLLDPGPLFMPDAASVGQGSANGLQSRSGGQAEQAYPAALSFPERQPTVDLLRNRVLRTPVEEAANLAAPRWFEGMARAEITLNEGAKRARAARIEVYELGHSGVVAGFELKEDEVFNANSWMPLELSVTVLDTGTLTRPVLVTSSGNERVDDRIRWLVGRDLLLKTRLRPGIYRMEVGP